MSPTSRSPSEPSLTERLAGRLARPMTAIDRACAAWHLLDWMGCALVGRASPAGQALAGVIASQPEGPCWLAGSRDHRAQAAEAAFLHGGLGSVYELDDLHRAALVHPSDTVVPVALAMAEREGATLGALLDAIVRGHEAAIVAGRLAGPRHYRHWYSTATCGVFGAAAAAASLLRLSPEATADALGLAGMQASGPWQCREEAGFAKQFATAHAARSGLGAADMAARGLQGPRRILEGPHGLLVATGAALDKDVPQAFADAVSGTAEETGLWQIHDVSFKPWPACRHVHPAIEAALTLRHRLGVDGANLTDRLAQIASIEVETYQDALAFADRPHPTTDHEARFSLQHTVAVALLQGQVTLDDAGARMREDARVVALRDRVQVRAAPRFDAAYPARFGSAVTLHIAPGIQAAASGPLFSSDPVTVTVDAALGDPEHPMSEDALRRKAVALLDAAGCRGDDAQRLVETCTGLGRPPTGPSATDAGLAGLWKALRTTSAPHGH